MTLLTVTADSSSAAALALLLAGAVPSPFTGRGEAGLGGPGRYSSGRGGDGKNEGRQNRMNMRFFALYAVRYLQLSV